MPRDSAGRIRCVVFDIDGTLYLERDYIQTGFRAVGEWMHRERGVTSFFEIAWKEFEGGRRREIFNVALQKLGLEASEELIRALLGVYRGHEPAIRLLPDSDECLRKLERKTFIGVISDGAVEGQQMKVATLGLTSRCNHIILTESLGIEYSKPHPRAFVEMQEIAKCHPEACVYIADNPVKDFISPNRLGWRTIRVRRPGGIHSAFGCSQESQPGREMPDLTELPAVLDFS